MPPPATRIDPYRGFNFRVEIDGTSVAAFSEVTGLMADGDTTDYRNGNDPNNWVRKLTGLRKFHTPVTLKHGQLKDFHLLGLVFRRRHRRIQRTAQLHHRAVRRDPDRRGVLPVQ